MEFSQQSAHRTAQLFFGSDKPLVKLGGGVSGFVYLSPDLRTALKVHQNVEGYTTEVKVYKELRRLSISKIRGLTIPRLRAVHDGLRLIQMDFVSPPFLLDFAGVLFRPPDFSEDVMDYWHRQIQERFGSNVSIVYEVYEALAELGLYYVDFRISNLKLDGLPDLEPENESEGDLSY